MVDSVSNGAASHNVTQFQRGNASKQSNVKRNAQATPQDEIAISTEAQDLAQVEQSVRDLRNALEGQGSVVLSGDGARLS